MLWNFEKTWKKALMLVFFGPFTRFFWLFENGKNGKNGKNVRKIAFFSIFSYALRDQMHIFDVTYNDNKRVIIIKKIKTQKNVKKTLKTFLKNQKMDNYFCPFFKF
jgi:hypothetical protein